MEEELDVDYKKLVDGFYITLKSTTLDFVRDCIDDIDWEERLIAVMGARGCGKTTLLLQYIKKNLSNTISEVLYVSLDDIYFIEHSLSDFINNFVKYGGKYLFLDEVHKYPTWSAEIKSAYDTHKNLKMVLTGSSILDLYKGHADLSRRLLTYTMAGLSFREFLWFDKGLKFNALSLEEITRNHVSIALDITSKTLILPAYKEYLNIGYYPFFKEGKKNYHRKLTNTINLILDSDLPAVHNMEYSSVYKLKRLLYMLASLGPYKPDITKLASQLEMSRNYVLKYLHFLKDAQLVNLLKDEDGGESILTKPEKVYLNNTNLAYALGTLANNIGSFREIFFFNQLNAKYKVGYTEMGDFKLEDKYIFEVGGKKKKFAQIKDEPNSFVVADETEVGFGNRIPLWLFGFTY